MKKKSLFCVLLLCVASVFACNCSVSSGRERVQSSPLDIEEVEVDLYRLHPDGSYGVRAGGIVYKKKHNGIGIATLNGDGESVEKQVTVNCMKSVEELLSESLVLIERLSDPLAGKRYRVEKKNATHRMVIDAEYGGVEMKIRVYLDFRDLDGVASLFKGTIFRWNEGKTFLEIDEAALFASPLPQCFDVTR